MIHNAFKVFYVQKDGRLTHTTWYVDTETEAVNCVLTHFHRGEPVFLKVIPVTVCQGCHKTVPSVDASKMQWKSCNQLQMELEDMMEKWIQS